MKTTEYLYGVSSTRWSSLNYADAIASRIKYAKKLMKKLASEMKDKVKEQAPYDEISELNQRLKDVDEAINFNKTLLDEISENMEHSSQDILDQAIKAIPIVKGGIVESQYFLGPKALIELEEQITNIEEKLYLAEHRLYEIKKIQKNDQID